VYSRTSLLYCASALSGELDPELLAEESDEDSELLEDPLELAENEQPCGRASTHERRRTARARRTARRRSWRMDSTS
jgi:hypothetical protein